MPTEIGRLLTAMITPFDAQGGVDYPQARRLARALLESGSDGLVVSGTTGESPSLTLDEKLRLFAEIVDAVGDDGAVVAGTGSYNTAESVELTREAQTLGVDAIMAVVPYYNKPPQEGLYRHFKAIAEATSLPFIPYNVPSRTSLNMTHETTLRLSQIDNVVGIKEASSDLDQIARVIEGAPPGFRVWSGNDNETFPIMCMGGYGVISVASHLVGAQIKGMMQLTLDGRTDEAAREHHRLHPMFKGLFVVSNPIPVKYALNRAGFAVGEPRLPLVAAEGSVAAQIDAVLSGYQLDIPVPAAR